MRQGDPQRQEGDNSKVGGLGTLLLLSHNSPAMPLQSIFRRQCQEWLPLAAEQPVGPVLACTGPREPGGLSPASLQWHLLT